MVHRSNSRADPEGDEAPGEEEMYHQGLRAHFPMSFGACLGAQFRQLIEDVILRAAMFVCGLASQHLAVCCARALRVSAWLAHEALSLSTAVRGLNKHVLASCHLLFVLQEE